MKTKRWTIKQLSLLLSIVLIATVTAGGSLAYIFTQTDGLTNTFKPVEVTCDVVETFDNNIKSNVKIQNTGDIAAYIRAAVVVTWQNDAGDVLSDIPEKGTDYSITYANDGWDIDTTDGYYYYTRVVPAGDNKVTGVLISECKQLKAAPEAGYYLCVEIIADAIQATPTNVVADNWGVTVSGTNISK